jgi:adenine-specific DNA-methyltransferase
MPQRKIMKKTRRSRVNISLENYVHTENKRVNNPPVGLVSSATDALIGNTTYAHDPHIDPQLSWAGKVEGTAFDVTNVSLHIHERIESQRIAKAFLKKNNQPAQLSFFENSDNDLPLLKAIHFYQHQQDWSNRLIAGDSLLVMNSLLNKEGMGSKVQMVYIDPPYGITYNSNFQPFLNRRDVKDNNDADIPAEPEMIKAFRDTWELGVHSYLTHLHDRLLLAKELLHESGSCFVQISDENVHHVKELMDETFGANNFVSLISFRTKIPLRTTHIPGIADYIVWYAKDINKVKFHRLFTHRELGGESQFSWVELEDGSRRKMTNEEKNNLSILPTNSRIFRLTDLVSAGRTESCVFEFELDGKSFFPSGGKSWKTNRTGMDKLIQMRRVMVTGNTPSYVFFADDYPVQEITNLWTDTQGATDKRYVVQTAEKVVQRCMLMVTDPGDLMLDPTCGSGTTAFIAEQWGRRWITCDTSRVAITLAKQRLMTAKFAYYKLAHSDEGISSGFDYKKAPHLTLGSLTKDEPKQDEVLYDQPIVEAGKVRVAGPFTVEAVPSLRTKPFDGSEAKIQLTGTELARSGSTSSLYQWIDELKATGVRATGGKFITFGRIEPTPGTKHIHAEAEMLSEQGQMQKAVVSFGPDYGPLEQRQVEEVIKEAKKLKDKPEFIIFAAFHFDPEAAKDIDQINNSKTEFTLLKAQMSVDLLTHDLRKKRSSNQSYWLIGQPDVEVIKGEKETYQVRVNGFDYYNPVSGEIESGSDKQIAMWLLDTDYDEQSILPEQIFFPMGDSSRDWTKLAKALNGAVDEDLLELFTGIVSKPFTAGENRKIAVKIIDNRGIESFVVKSL